VLLSEADQTKRSYENLDKKLGDMCNRQLNKLEVTFKSIFRILDSKRKEFGVMIKEFYQE